MSLFARKPLSRILAESEGGEHSLKRTLTAGGLIALGIGAIIGAGIFSLTGKAAAENAGPAITISFIAAAFGCVFAGLCYSEFATMVPIAGSAYTYAYATMGELIAWIIGWDLVLEYAVAASTVSISWSATLVSILHDFGIDLPNAIVASPLQGGTGGLFNLPAVFIVVALTLLLVVGIQESARVNNVIVALKVTVVVLFIVLGWAYIDQANYTPYIPPAEDTGRYGWSGILRAAGIIFFAYIGFDAVSTAAQEAKNPQRDMPIGIIGSLALCTVLYILYAHVLTGVVNYKDLLTAAPLAVALDRIPYPVMGKLMKIASLAGLTSVILVMLLGQSRIFFTMSKDGLLPKFFEECHPKFRTPWKSNLLLMVFVSIFAAFAPISIVGEMTSIGTLLAFVIVCAGILVMRKTDPNANRPFRTPLVPFVPIMGMLVNFALMMGLPGDTWIRLVVWLLIGFLIYFGYGRSHSKLQASLNGKS
ncbi:MAG: amino acid permease [Bryobacteraceae bacterium]|nr:amino acid permease [Bryobacteraceae bacterium]